MRLPGSEKVMVGYDLSYSYAQISCYVTGNEERLILNAQFDNLGKGASGAAIQCLNIMMGCEEDKGLNL